MSDGIKIKNWRLKECPDHKLHLSQMSHFCEDHLIKVVFFQHGAISFSITIIQCLHKCLRLSECTFIIGNSEHGNSYFAVCKDLIIFTQSHSYIRPF